MKYRITPKNILTKKELRKVILKWVLYSICLIIFYMIMRAGIFGNWQPFLIIPLAVSVSMRERELSSCVFALFCGYFIDISCRFIFGFSAVWLMVVCVAASLLSRNLIRVNILNFLWINFVAVLLEFSMDYLFNVMIWNIPGGNSVLKLSSVPSVVATVIFSPIVYIIIRQINILCSENNRLFFYSDNNQNDEDEYID